MVREPVLRVTVCAAASWSAVGLAADRALNLAHQFAAVAPPERVRPARLVVHTIPPAHVGLHAGPVLFQEGDYFGQTVNLASRIAEYARPGEVLVSQAVADAAEGADATFTRIGPVELKGVSDPISLLAAHRAASSAAG